MYEELLYSDRYDVERIIQNENFIRMLYGGVTPVEIDVYYGITGNTYVVTDEDFINDYIIDFKYLKIVDKLENQEVKDQSLDEIKYTFIFEDGDEVEFDMISEMWYFDEENKIEYQFYNTQNLQSTNSDVVYEKDAEEQEGE